MAVLLTACGGGGGGKTNSTPTPTSVTVSGFVRYEFPPPNNNCNGLNLAAPETRPIRAATVELINAGTGAQIASTVSGDNGAYSFNNVATNTLVQVRVRAELKQAGNPGWDVEVRDNYVMGGSDNGEFPPAGLSSRALYRLDGSEFNTGTASVTRNLTATTGWNGSSYADARAAAPFAILDTMYSMIQFVRAADPNAHFRPLDAFWSVNNVVAAGDVDITAGELPTSAYYAGIDSLFILGDDTSDTDEFDDHIVAHEWGHYFEDNLSRSDSPGGNHFLGESLEATLAFSEGWGYAIAAMGLNDPLYCDTGRPGTSGGFGLNAETSGFGVQGWFNEVSVLTFLYDLWDTDDDGTDDDSIGFAPIYEVMTGPQIFTEGFTTLYAFATELRSSVGVQGQALIDSQLERENIVSGAALDIWATNEVNDANVPDGNPPSEPDIAQDILPLYVDYVADNPPVNICATSYLDGLDRHGNNIGEDRYLRITVPFDDEYDVSVVTTTPTPPSADPNDRDQSDPDIYVIRGSTAESVGSGTAPDNNFEPTFRTAQLLAGETYVAIVEEWRFDDDEASIDYPQRICFDVSFTSTP
jgi:hypothetical protein